VEFGEATRRKGALLERVDRICSGYAYGDARTGSAGLVDAILVA
jgi:hypothetical protein